VDTSKNTAPKVPDHELIRRDAAAVHPERTPSEHETAARSIAAVSYREEIRAMMKAGTLDSEDDEL
jgi:hypothetical protein